MQNVVSFGVKEHVRSRDRNCCPGMRGQRPVGVLSSDQRVAMDERGCWLCPLDGCSFGRRFAEDWVKTVGGLHWPPQSGCSDRRVWKGSLVARFAHRQGTGTGNASGLPYE